MAERRRSSDSKDEEEDSRPTRTLEEDDFPPPSNALNLHQPIELYIPSPRVDDRLRLYENRVEKLRALGFSEDVSQQLAAMNFLADGRTGNQVRCYLCGYWCTCQRDSSFDQFIQHHKNDNPFCARFLGEAPQPETSGTDAEVQDGATAAIVEDANVNDAVVEPAQELPDDAIAADVITTLMSMFTDELRIRVREREQVPTLLDTINLRDEDILEMGMAEGILLGIHAREREPVLALLDLVHQGENNENWLPEENSDHEDGVH